MLVGGQLAAMSAVVSGTTAPVPSGAYDIFDILIETILKRSPSFILLFPSWVNARIDRQKSCLSSRPGAAPGAGGKYFALGETRRCVCWCLSRAPQNI